MTKDPSEDFRGPFRLLKSDADHSTRCVAVLPDQRRCEQTGEIHDPLRGGDICRLHAAEFVLQEIRPKLEHRLHELDELLPTGKVGPDQDQSGPDEAQNPVETCKYSWQGTPCRGPLLPLWSHRKVCWSHAFYHEVASSRDLFASLLGIIDSLRSMDKAPIPPSSQDCQYVSPDPESEHSYRFTRCDALAYVRAVDSGENLSSADIDVLMRRIRAELDEAGGLAESSLIAELRGYEHAKRSKSGSVSGTTVVRLDNFDCGKSSGYGAPL